MASRQSELAFIQSTSSRMSVLLDAQNGAGARAAEMPKPYRIDTGDACGPRIASKRNHP
jgi:hypothetical protein